MYKAGGRDSMVMHTRGGTHHGRRVHDASPAPRYARMAYAWPSSPHIETHVRSTRLSKRERPAAGHEGARSLAHEEGVEQVVEHVARLAARVGDVGLLVAEPADRVQPVALEDVAAVEHAVVVAQQHVARLHRHVHDVVLAHLTRGRGRVRVRMRVRMRVRVRVRVRVRMRVRARVRARAMG